MGAAAEGRPRCVAMDYLRFSEILLAILLLAGILHPATYGGGPFG